MNLPSELIEARAVEREHRAALAQMEAERLAAEFTTRQNVEAHDRAIGGLLDRGGRRIVRDILAAIEVQPDMPEKMIQARVHRAVFAGLTWMSSASKPCRVCAAEQARERPRRETP